MPCAFQRFDGGDGGIDRITVVGAAAAVEQAVFVLGRPGAEVVAPAVEFGLLVEVAVEQHGVAADPALVAGISKKITGVRPSRRTTSSFRPGTLRPRPRLRGVAHHAVDQAVFGPVGVEHRALGRHRDVVGQRRHDALVPGGIGKGGQGRGFNRGSRCVHGVSLQPAEARKASQRVRWPSTSPARAR
jgi:hypothetical protein